MPKGKVDHGRVSVAVVAVLAGAVPQPLDFLPRAVSQGLVSMRALPLALTLCRTVALSAADNCVMSVVRCNCLDFCLYLSFKFVASTPS
jgi:hypothetical protein